MVKRLVILTIIIIASLALTLSRLTKSTFAPCWPIRGFDLANTSYYNYPSSIHFINPIIKMQRRFGNFNLTGQAQGLERNRGSGILTGRVNGKVVIGVNASLYSSDGDLLFRYDGDYYSYLLYDIDNDGDVEILIAVSGKILVYKADGELVKSIRVEGRVFEMRATDLDGDGDPELVTSEDIKVLKGFSQSVKRQVCLYDLSTGDRKWSYQIGPSPHLSAFADITGDGKLEIICGTYSCENGVFYNDMADTSSGYVFVLTNEGERLWFKPFKAHFASIRPSVSDLDGDGDKELIVVCGSWLRSWGMIAILDPKDGHILYKYPNNGALSNSFTGFGIADLDNDGKKEVVCSILGKHGKVLALNEKLQPITKEYIISAPRLDYDYVIAYIEAINDLDGDGYPEIICSSVIEKEVSTDPRFDYSRLFEPQLLILGHKLTRKMVFPLEERCIEAIVSDIDPGGANEIIIFSDQISICSVEEGTS